VDSNGLVGTAAWMAPEAARGMYGPPMDVFSFGMVMYELLTCKFPWADSGYDFNHQILKAVMRGERPPMITVDREGAPSGFVDMMEACWRQDMAQRPSFTGVRAMLEQVAAQYVEPR
jgi:serine/threonine protein kinase